jgi:hypothetical protein
VWNGSLHRALVGVLKQHAVIEFLTAKGAYPTEIHCWMQVVYGVYCVDVSVMSAG